MTLETTTNKIAYPGDGITTNFSFNFKTLNAVDIFVYEDDSLTSAAVVVNLNPDQQVSPGGSVDLSTAPVTGVTVSILRTVDSTQTRAYPIGGAFPSASHEEGLDKLTMLDQQQEEKLARQVRLPLGYPLPGLDMPFPEQLLTLRWNVTADNLENWDPKTAGLLDPNAFPEVAATKALANDLTIINGKKVHITSPDGGSFTMRTGAPVGTYNDNGGTLTGTKFTPGDGSTGFERDDAGLMLDKWFQGGVPTGIAISTAKFTDSEWGEFDLAAASYGIKAEISTVDARFLISAPTVSTKTLLSFHNPNGNIGTIQATGSQTLYNTTSDKDLKVSHGSIDNPTSILSRIEIHEYHFTADDGKEIHHGVMAQDCYKVYKDPISKPVSKGGTWAADYSKFVPLLISSVQELTERVEYLEKKLNEH